MLFSTTSRRALRNRGPPPALLTSRSPRRRYRSPLPSLSRRSFLSLSPLRPRGPALPRACRIASRLRTQPLMAKAASRPRQPSPSIRTRAAGLTWTCSITSKAAARGSAKTASSSARPSGTSCRFLIGRAKYSAKTPSLPAIPRADLSGQCFSSPPAQYAHVAAAAVDLADDPFARKVGTARPRLLDDADELMARYAPEAPVAFHDLLVRPADAGHGHPYQGLARSRVGAAGTVVES